MESPRKTPGPTADRAFTTGIRTAIVGAFVCLGALYWFEVLTPLFVGVTLVVLFPIYLLVVASVLSVWLGYDRDPSDLRRVRRPDAPRSLLELDRP